MKKSGPNDGFHIPYGNRRLFHALELLLSSDAESVTEGYKYDIVDLLRQILSNYGQKLYAQVSEHFKNREIEGFRESSVQFLELLLDIDRLLSTREEFRLDRWIEDACSWGNSLPEQDYYEYNASVLITLWGNEQNPMIFDYAWREWSGLIGQYYRKRWELFFDMLLQCLEKDEEYIEDTLPMVYGREAFRANDFYNRLANWEVSWVNSVKSFRSSEASELEMVTVLMKKYRALV